MKTAGKIILHSLCVGVLWTFGGFHSSAISPDPANPTLHTYQVKGVIERIAPDLRQATIQHEAIPGYMMAMTMDFPVENAVELEGLSPGDTVAFTLVVDDDRARITAIRRTGHVEIKAADAMPMNGPGESNPLLKPGDKVPDGALLGEDGRSIHLSDFRGKVVAFTFFFTRCPLPNYCPLMNRNFAEARKLLLSNREGPANWQFLSISFDSDFDRPEILSSYGGYYRSNNSDRWLFASASPATLAEMAPPLGLMIMGREGSISHNLRTVVVDPEGRIYRQFNDNLWTPRQLADAMLEAARSSRSK